MRRILVIALLAAAGGCDRPLSEERFGAYRLEDQRLLSVRESAPGTLRVRMFDSGETRRLVSEDGDVWRPISESLTRDGLTGTRLRFGDGGLILEAEDGAAVPGDKLAFPVRREIIEVDDVRLNVRLTLPEGAGPHPAVIVAHGSGDDAATRTYGTPDFFPAFGIASVVYDKRGTGSSSGTYSHDFVALAEDLAGVAAWTAEQQEIDAARIGVTGYSQGGWIGPLAATLSPDLAFVIANYGMIDSPRREAVLETEAHMRRLGYGAEAAAEAGRLADAAVDAEASGYRDWARFDALAAEYADRPWLEDVDEPLSDFLRWPHWVVRIVAPYLAPPGLRWDYDSMAALDILAERGIPSAWFVASHDSSAPNAFTLAELERRRSAGEPVRVHVFPGTDHGFVLFEDGEDGRRRYGNHHPDYFRTEVAMARRLAGLVAAADVEATAAADDDTREAAGVKAAP